MGTNANGYEIRLSLLQLARDMLFQQWHGLEHLREANPQTDFSCVEEEYAYGRMRLPPTPEDIQALALDLYKFVVRKDVADA